ncbi:sigma-54-dependent transcriptional regulator [Endothiovibrio diazotrophicus]
MTAPYILVVDDEPDIRNLVQEILADEGYEVAVAENGASARERRRDRRPDLILLDIWMPDTDGITLLKEWNEGNALHCPVIMMSGHGTVETAVEATRLGAYDYLEKPLSLAKLLLTVERALEADQLARENRGLRSRTETVIEPVGKGAAMQALREQVRLVAQRETAVLLIGEAGSGKETFARYLHALSPRADAPFVEVPVGTITGQNSALELFGSEEGGRVHFGRLEQANGGTLFLDGIADMEMQTQTHLASALQGQGFLRLGGSTEVRTDVRLIASTQRDLEEEVAAGNFREDLYYQLNVVPIVLPPLREHCEDVPELLNYYLNWFADHDKLPYRRFSVAAQNRLRNHGWPGNIRELKNLVQRLLILSNQEEIGQEEVEQALGSVRPAGDEGGGLSPALLDQPLREAREAFEKLYLEHQLREVGGNMSQLAKRAGMERTHLYRKLRALGIDPKEVVG